MNSWFKEETLFDVEDEGLRKAVVVDTDGVFSKVYDVLRGEGRSSTFGGGVDDIGEVFGGGFFEIVGSWEVKEDVKEGEGKDVEMFFSFGKEHREGVFDLCFGKRSFFFEFLDETREVSQVMVRWERVKELWIRLSEECKDFSVFGIRLRGVICGDELREAMKDFGVDDEGLDVISEKEVIEGEEESAGRFHGYDGVGELVKEGEKLREAFLGHREGLGQDEVFIFEDSDVKGIFGDVNTDEGVHGSTSLCGVFLVDVPRSILPCGRGLGSLTNLLGVEEKIDRLLSRLLSLRVMESLSLFILLVFILLVYNSTYIKQKLT
ncbi:hypothetical protein [Thermodesulfobacterium commune]